LAVRFPKAFKVFNERGIRNAPCVYFAAGVVLAAFFSFAASTSLMSFLAVSSAS